MKRKKRTHNFMLSGIPEKSTSSEDIISIKNIINDVIPGQNYGWYIGRLGKNKDIVNIDLSRFIWKI